jgi:hypothetical protein
MSAGTKDDPWRLTTPPWTSSYEMYIDPADDEVLVCQVGSTKLTYQRRDRRPARVAAHHR